MDWLTVIEIALSAALGIATVYAIIKGPQWASRASTKEIADMLRTHSRDERRFQILRGLLTYRVDDIHHDFLVALNTLDVEYHDNKEVLNFRKKFLEITRTRTPSEAEVGKEASEAAARRASDETFTALTNLVMAVAGTLGISVETLSFHQGRYRPDALTWVNRRHNLIYNALAELLNGNASLFVTNVDEENLQERVEGNKPPEYPRVNYLRLPALPTQPRRPPWPPRKPLGCESAPSPSSFGRRA